MKALHRNPVFIAFGLVIAIIGGAMLDRSLPSHGEEIAVEFIGYKPATSFHPDYGGPFPIGSRVALFRISNRTDRLLRRIGAVIDQRTESGWAPQAGQPTLLELRGSGWFNLPPRSSGHFRVLEPSGADPWRVKFSFMDIRNVDGPGWRGLLRWIPIYRLLPMATGTSTEVTR